MVEFLLYVFVCENIGIYDNGLNNENMQIEEQKRTGKISVRERNIYADKMKKSMQLLLKLCVYKVSSNKK